MLRELDDEHFEEIKYETISHICAESVKKARNAKEWTQAQLAKAISVKTHAIIEIENGTAKYEPEIINAIQKSTGEHIDRGRKKKGKK
jgi:putative transcription factor